ncbi:MAG: DUF4212 domain-containing protein [Ottowia sp.]|nr:DUF4212 domain-containing protein [Ottowia sp.]
MNAAAHDGEAQGGLPAPLNHPRPAAVRRLRQGLLLLWLAASFGAAFFARELQHLSVAGWPLHFWWGAQGSLMAAFLIVAFYAWAMERRPPALREDEAPEHDEQDVASI